MEKSKTNVISVTMPLLRQAIWGHILKRTVEKSQTNATNVTMPHIAQAIWGNIWKHTVVQQMQPMWFCILTSRQFQETFDNAQKKKRNKCNQLIPQSSYTLFLFWANQWFYLVSLVQKIGDPIFGLFAHFYGQKLPQSAINEAYWAISRPGRSKLVDPGWI